jgi:hypothetical protein
LLEQAITLCRCIAFDEFRQMLPVLTEVDAAPLPDDEEDIARFSVASLMTRSKAG